MSEALEIVTLHCACLELHGDGLLLSGGSGAGKSTLSVAMAQTGFSFISDDWTYFSNSGGNLCARNIAGPVKLMPDAASYFGELRKLRPAVSLNGELAYEVDLELTFGVQRSLSCRPRWVVFLERWSRPGHSFSRVSPHNVAERLEYDLEPLPAELSRIQHLQCGVISELAHGSCWLLSYGDSPRETAAALTEFCSDPTRVEAVQTRDDATPGGFARTGQDVIQRFTPTPFATEITANGYPIRLETNSRSILERVQAGLGSRNFADVESDFSWKLIEDADADSGGSRPSSCTVTVNGLSLENIGHRSFLAVDAEARIGVGFLTESLVNNNGSWIEEHLLPQLVSAAGERQ